jgi:hypothetical protein
MVDSKRSYFSKFLRLHKKLNTFHLPNHDHIEYSIGYETFWTGRIRKYYSRSDTFDRKNLHNLGNAINPPIISLQYGMLPVLKSGNRR